MGVQSGEDGEHGHEIKRLHFFANGLRRNTHIAFVFAMPPLDTDDEPADGKTKVNETSPASSRLVWSEYDDRRSA